MPKIEKMDDFSCLGPGKGRPDREFRFVRSRIEKIQFPRNENISQTF